MDSTDTILLLKTLMGLERIRRIKMAFSLLNVVKDLLLYNLRSFRDVRGGISFRSLQLRASLSLFSNSHET